MKSEKEIIKSPVYWLNLFQNQLFGELTDYMKTNGFNQNDMAKKMNVSRGYINQVLNGNFNFTLKKLIELSLAMNKIPSISFED
ncbi:MAG: helix-turn-helix transcriptional regulator [bacterium]|nr:helix-turn-helix transcriptional regulator [bacterium]